MNFEHEDGGPEYGIGQSKTISKGSHLSVQAVGFSSHSVCVEHTYHCEAYCLKDYCVDIRFMGTGRSMRIQPGAFTITHGSAHARDDKRSCVPSYFRNVPLRAPRPVSAALTGNERLPTRPCTPLNPAHHWLWDRRRGIPGTRPGSPPSPPALPYPLLPACRARRSGFRGLE